MEAAFFDLDKTVIAKPSLVAFGRPLYDAGMISRGVILRALWSNFLFHYFGAGEDRMRKFRSSALRITRGWDQALVSAIVREALVEVIEPIVYAEALDLINEHRRLGRRVYLISASPEEIVAPLAKFLGVDEAIASRAELDEAGRYTGEVAFWSYGPYKAEAIREAAARDGIDLERSYAYSDSGTDVPMLEVVGHPVAVNPDRDLARVARERGWETRWFAYGVPLRERVSMPPPGRILAAVSVVVLVGGAAAAGTWWWISRRPRPSGTLVPRRPVERRRAPLSRWAEAGRAATGRLQSRRAAPSPSAAVADRWAPGRGQAGDEARRSARPPVDRASDREAPAITRALAASTRAATWARWAACR